MTKTIEMCKKLAKKLIVIYLFLPILFLNCNSKNNSKSDNKNAQDTAYNVKVTIENVINKWNKANSEKDINTLSKLYTDNVNYYGLNYSKEQCLNDKSSFFNKYTDFYQTLIGQIKIETITDSNQKASFLKRVTIKNIPKDYPSYLILLKKDSSWLIEKESDSITDGNLSKKDSLKNHRSNVYYYEPDTSTLNGKLYKEMFYGPPGFGENPKEDRKEYCFILYLDKSINVVPSRHSNMSGFDEPNENIKRLQIFANDTIDKLLDSKLGSRVLVKGTLFEAQTGHHHTKVLMDVLELK